MINHVNLEGIVTKTWQYSGARFARLACYPDPGRTLKNGHESANHREEPEYITLRFQDPTQARAASTLQNGDTVRASGWLQSREYDISLADFAKKAKGPDETLARLHALAGEIGDRASRGHVLTEIVVERFLVTQQARS